MSRRLTHTHGTIKSVSFSLRLNTFKAKGFVCFTFRRPNVQAPLRNCNSSNDVLFTVEIAISALHSSQASSSANWHINRFLSIRYSCTLFTSFSLIVDVCALRSSKQIVHVRPDELSREEREEMSNWKIRQRINRINKKTKRENLLLFFALYTLQRVSQKNTFKSHQNWIFQQYENWME